MEVLPSVAVDVAIGSAGIILVKSSRWMGEDLLREPGRLSQDGRKLVVGNDLQRSSLAAAF
jgi:hypothetical protein